MKSHFPAETLLLREPKDAQYTITFFYRLSPNGTENYISHIEVPVSILGNQFSETFDMTTFGLPVGVDYDFVVYVRDSS